MKQLVKTNIRKPKIPKLHIMASTAVVVAATALLAGLAVDKAKADPVDHPPNIVLIYADDMGYGDTRLTDSNSIAATPNIKSIGDNGVNFTEGYVASPVCSPSRAGLMSSRYPARTGFDSNALTRYNSTKNPSYSIASVLKGISGLHYQTMAIGKWDLGNGCDQMPVARGFDDFYGIPGGISSYYRKDGNAPSDATFIDPATGLITTSATVKSNQSLNIKEFAGGCTYSAPAQPMTQYLTDEFTDRAVSYIQNHGGASQDPFFLYLAYNSPHVPLQVPYSYYAPYASMSGLTDGQKIYHAMIDNLDDNVGRVLDALGRAAYSQKYQDTIVIFVSDNGPQIGSSGPLVGAKHSLLEGGIRMAFAVQWPGHYPDHTVSDTMVSTLDLMPTVFKAACPSGCTQPPHAGRNLNPLLTGDDTSPPHDYLYWKYVNEDGVGATDQVQLAVNNGDYKYMKTIDPDATVHEYLYEIRSDASPEQSGDNRFNDPLLATVQADLIHALHEWNKDNPIDENFDDGNAQGWFSYSRDSDAPNPDWEIDSSQQYKGTGKRGIRSMQVGSYNGDLIYESDVQLKTGGKAGLIIRSEDYGQDGPFMFKGYLVQIEGSNKVTLSRVDADGTGAVLLNSVAATIHQNQTYHLKVDANGHVIKVYLDGTLLFTRDLAKNNSGGTSIDPTNSVQYLEGSVGLRIGSPNDTTDATATFDQIVLTKQ